MSETFNDTIYKKHILILSVNISYSVRLIANNATEIFQIALVDDFFAVSIENDTFGCVTGKVLLFDDGLKDVRTEHSIKRSKSHLKFRLAMINRINRHVDDTAVVTFQPAM